MMQVSSLPYRLFYRLVNQEREVNEDSTLLKIYVKSPQNL